MVTWVSKGGFKLCLCLYLLFFCLLAEWFSTSWYIAREHGRARDILFCWRIYSTSHCSFLPCRECTNRRNKSSVECFNLEKKIGLDGKSYFLIFPWISWDLSILISRQRSKHKHSPNSKFSSLQRNHSNRIVTRNSSHSSRTSHCWTLDNCSYNNSTIQIPQVKIWSHLHLLLQLFPWKVSASKRKIN